MLGFYFGKGDWENKIQSAVHRYDVAGGGSLFDQVISCDDRHNCGFGIEGN